MFSRSVMLLTLLICITVTSANVQDRIITGSQNEVVCQSVQSVPLCQELGYDNTSFPNLRGHLTAKEANEELAHFEALIETGCSNAIVHLLCSIYAPPCMQAYSNLRYPPCKSLCEHVRDGCAATLRQYSNYDWPPGPHLNCSNYAKAENNHLCFGPTDLSILKIPRTSVKCKLLVLSCLTALEVHLISFAGRVYIYAQHKISIYRTYAIFLYIYYILLKYHSCSVFVFG